MAVNRGSTQGARATATAQQRSQAHDATATYQHDARGAQSHRDTAQCHPVAFRVPYVQPTQKRGRGDALKSPRKWQSRNPAPTAAPLRLLTDATTVLGEVPIEEDDHPLPGVLSFRLGVGQPDSAFDDADLGRVTANRS
jgi:hypothetical protein